MSKMFNLYDNPNLDERDEIDFEVYNAVMLRNIKDELLGVKAKFNSYFNLYFKLVGDDRSLIDLLPYADFHFEILDKKHRVVYTAEPEYYVNHDILAVEVQSCDDTTLYYGNYFIHLYMTVENEDETVDTYDLYTQADGILMIE